MDAAARPIAKSNSTWKLPSPGRRGQACHPDLLPHRPAFSRSAERGLPTWSRAGRRMEANSALACYICYKNRANYSFVSSVPRVANQRNCSRHLGCGPRSPHAIGSWKRCFGRGRPTASGPSVQSSAFLGIPRRLEAPRASPCTVYRFEK
jgi:hypothetical protein